MKKNIIALICARGGSKGIKNKNLLKINGKTLLQISIEHSKKIRLIKQVYVSTDSVKIAKEAKKYGAIVPFIRPKNLSRDKTPEILVWRHAINFLKNKLNVKPDYIISLPTTSPLRKISDINLCIKKITENNLDMLFTATPSSRNPYFNMIKKTNGKISLVSNKKNKFFFRRQDAPKCYDLCTVCFVFKPDYVKKNLNLYNGNVDFFEISKKTSLDIDTNFDYQLAKLLY
jgi:CMP-N-acetylneuraminic acid synthetase